MPLRYFCPSSQQKRVILYGEWVEDNILVPVAHRQYVFTMPKRLPPTFSCRRAWLAFALMGPTLASGY